MFAYFYEIPSLPFQDIEKPKRRGRTDVKTIYPPTHTHTQTQFAWSIIKIPHPLYYNVYLLSSMLSDI